MAITRDQTAGSSTAINAASFTLTWATPPAAGSKVVIKINSVFATVTSVFDNGVTPSTFTQDATSNAFTNYNLYIYRADGISLPASGSYKVTVVLNNSSNAYFASGRSYLGVRPGGPVTTNNSSGTSTSVTTGTVTTPLPNSLLIGVFGDESALNPETITLTASGWVSEAAFTNGSIQAGACADAIVSAYSSTQAGTWTLGDSVGWLGLVAAYPILVPDVAGAADSIRITHPFGDSAAAVDSIQVNKGTPDAAGAVDTITVTNVGVAVPLSEAGGAFDQIWVQKTTAPAPVPALATLTQAPRVFVKSQMPRMHIQNLINGSWIHRDVQGITSPSITWSLNAADSFTCTLAPPRPDMLSGGEPLLQEWRDACYLEEDHEIKWGGILTSSTFNGPQWQQTWTGFSGFPQGMVYEGAVYKKLGVEAMDVVRYLWDWIQSGTGASANLNMQMPTTNTGYKLGAQIPSGIHDTLSANSSKGQSVLYVDNPSAWSVKDVLQVTGDGGTYTIKSISGHALTLTTTLKGASSLYHNKNTLIQIIPPTPYELDWWNNTDIGQEIESIRAEAVFDWRELHYWGSSQDVVKHTWVVGAPRLGMYRQELRFCEGENIIQPAQVTRDGSKYAQRVVGVGNGQGSSTIRSTVTGSGGRLARSSVYTDQTVKTTARMTSIARKVQQTMDNIDEVTQIVVKNHPHAPFGSFFCGDDIMVILCTGWRNTSIKSRITSMTQDPTTDLMTINLARSDSFTYLAQSGQDGSI